MSAPEPPPAERDPAPAAAEQVRFSGRQVVGVLLIAVGALWLLDTTGVLDLDYRLLLSGALMVVGIVLIATPRQRGGGLIALGVVLTLILSVLALIPFPMAGGIGEEVRRPSGAPAQKLEFSHAIGKLTVDLRDLELDGTSQSVEASLGMGELVVRIPEDTAVEVRVRIGAGEAIVANRARGGVGVRFEERLGEGSDRIVLDVSVGFGKIEVRT